MSTVRDAIRYRMDELVHADIQTWLQPAPEPERAVVVICMLGGHGNGRRGEVSFMMMGSVS